MQLSPNTHTRANVVTVFRTAFPVVHPGWQPYRELLEKQHGIETDGVSSLKRGILRAKQRGEGAWLSFWRLVRSVKPKSRTWHWPHAKKQDYHLQHAIFSKVTSNICFQETWKRSFCVPDKKTFKKRFNQNVCQTLTRCLRDPAVLFHDFSSQTTLIVLPSLQTPLMNLVQKYCRYLVLKSVFVVFEKIPASELNFSKQKNFSLFLCLKFSVTQQQLHNRKKKR